MRVLTPNRQPLWMRDVGKVQQNVGERDPTNKVGYVFNDKYIDIPKKNNNEKKTQEN